MTSPHFCQMMSMFFFSERSALINNISTCSRLGDWYLHHVKLLIIQVYLDHYNSQRLLQHVLNQVEITFIYQTS